MTTSTGTLLTLGSVDDYLGPQHGRFFGSGYRRATYGISEVHVGAGGAQPGGTAARIDVAYPSDWSRKADGDMRPHLSTMDMLVLGAQLSEAHLTTAFGLDPAMRRRAWIRKVTLRSGSTPQEDLTGLEGTARLAATHPADIDGMSVSTYDSRVGAMRGRYEIVHPVARYAARDGHFADLDAVLGPAAGRYYGRGFQAQQHRIEDVRVDMTQLRSTAQVSLGGAASPAEGLEGQYQPSWSLLDCFIVNLQLTQVMLYELDAVRRQDSNTLWMLKTTLQTDRPRRPVAGATPTHAAITGKHVVELRGGRWREITTAGSCAGVAFRSSFAHELPAGHPATV